MIQKEYDEKVYKSPIYKLKRLLKKDESFDLHEKNAYFKRRVIELVKMLKEVHKSHRHLKPNYLQLRKNYLPMLSSKLYQAVKGDLVDEQF